MSANVKTQCVQWAKNSLTLINMPSFSSLNIHSAECVCVCACVEIDFRYAGYWIRMHFIDCILWSSNLSVEQKSTIIEFNKLNFKSIRILRLKSLPSPYHWNRCSPTIDFNALTHISHFTSNKRAHQTTHSTQIYILIDVMMLRVNATHKKERPESSADLNRITLNAITVTKG